MSEYSSKADMSWWLGSKKGRQCWCGKNQASGFDHQKTWHPHSCGSEKCKELEALYNSLPDGEENEWERII